MLFRGIPAPASLKLRWNRGMAARAPLLFRGNLAPASLQPLERERAHHVEQDSSGAHSPRPR